jgi:hypothetical protein
MFMAYRSIFLFGLLVILPASVYAEEGGVNSELPLNRIDLTTVFFDTNDTDSLTGIIGYTRNLSFNSNLDVRTSYLDSRFGDSGGSGIGDTTVTFSYLRNEKVSVAPWLPRKLGSGISVTLPTGNEDRGLGLGSTLLTPFLGTQVPITDSIAFTPTIAYAYSTSPIITGADVRIILLDLGVTWVGKSGLWTSLFYGYIRDIEVDDYTTGGRLSFGKVFPSGWGFTASYIDLESFNPGQLPTEDGRFNQVYELTLLYGF